MTVLNVPIQLRRGNEVDCPTHMLAGEVYVCLDSGKIFAGTGSSTSPKQLGGSAALWGGITGTLSSQTDLQTVLTSLAAADTTEASTRAAADSTNATAIITEGTTRAFADSTEATARAAADTVLQGNITSEATARAAADSTNATAISTEASRATTAEGLLAPIASPALTGTPTAPTNVTATDNTTQVATNAFVQSALATHGGVINTTIPSATFLGLTGAAATDIVLVAAPGAGKAIIVESVYLEIKFNSISYTTGTGNLIVEFNQGGAHAGILAAPILTTAQLKGSATVSTYQPPAAQSAVSNAALVINLSTAVQYLAGNSTFNVSVRYRIVAV